MFAFSNLDLFMRMHPDLFSEQERVEVLTNLLRQQSARMGTYLSTVADEILEVELAAMFLEEITNPAPAHFELFAAQSAQQDKLIVLVEQDGKLATQAVLPEEYVVPRATG